MKTTNRKDRIRVITVGPEEHRRVKILAAKVDCTLSDYVRTLINNAWDIHARKENSTHGKTEQTIRN